MTMTQSENPHKNSLSGYTFQIAISAGSMKRVCAFFTVGGVEVGGILQGSTRLI